VLAAAPAAAQSPIDAARQLYNQGNYEAAVKLAAKLRRDPGSANAANLVLGRSYLERFRQSADRADLVAGREALREVRPSILPPREQAEYLVGLGESLYLQEAYGAAADIFASAFERGRDLGPRAFDRVFDWWATSLDRLAQSGLMENTESLYTEILDRAETALVHSPGSSAPSYWLVVASRSLGDPVRAWDAAVAGWVRAPMADDHGALLRADLDRLVLEAIIPERVRQMASTDRDRERAATTLRAAWDELKKDWSPR
jgi:tetratricopeptide (TPR) repeat protein